MHPYIYTGLPGRIQAFAICKMIEGYQHTDKRKRHLAAQHVIAQIYGISVEDLQNPPDRRMMFVEARSMIFFYLRIMGYKCTEIARLYSRDHSSVIHNTKKFKQVLKLKKAPERAGFVRLLYECGHIPALIVNTIPGSEYLDEIFDREFYDEFFDLNLARYDELVSKHDRRKLVAKLKNKQLKESVDSTYFSRMRGTSLDSMYHRNYKAHNR